MGWKEHAIALHLRAGKTGRRAILIDCLDPAHLDGAELRAARRKLGVVFQQLNLLRSRTAAANIALPLQLSGVAKPRIRERVAELLDWFGLEEKAASMLRNCPEASDSGWPLPALCL